MLLDEEQELYDAGYEKCIDCGEYVEEWTKCEQCNFPICKTCVIDHPVTGIFLCKKCYDCKEE